VTRLRPRVLHVVLSLDPGGTERLVLEIARRLHAEMPMAVCCLDGRGAWASDLETEGIPVSSLSRRPGFHPMLGRAIAGLCRRDHIDVIHAHHYSPFVYAALARIWMPRLCVIFTEHGRLSDAPPSTKRRTANRVFGLFPRRVFAVSEDVRQHLVAEGFSASAVDVIYNGIDVGPIADSSDRDRVRADLNAGAGVFVIGTIARLDPVKDLGTLFRAVATLASAIPLRVLIAGDGPERSFLERLASELCIGDHVCFLGYRENARDYLAACDVYVNTSISEGVSLTILEAMAAALPVVATRVGGTPEVVDESCGRLVPARDPTALARALADLAAEPDTRRSLGLAGRRRVGERFTLDRMVHEYAEVYRTAAPARSRATGF
jgi:glycosyltransferase involved in cell wall biosynthesis